MYRGLMQVNLFAGPPRYALSDVNVTIGRATAVARRPAGVVGVWSPPQSGGPGGSGRSGNGLGFPGGARRHALRRLRPHDRRRAARRAGGGWGGGVVGPSQGLQAVPQAGYRAMPAVDALAREQRLRASRQALWRWLVAGFCMMQVMMYAW